MDMLCSFVFKSKVEVVIMEILISLFVLKQSGGNNHGNVELPFYCKNNIELTIIRVYFFGGGQNM